MKFKTKRRLIIAISLILLLVLYIFKNYSLMIRGLSTIFGLFVFYFFDHAFCIRFKLRHYIYILIILTFGILLSPLYYMYEAYDKILHFAMPILGCIMMFFVVNKLKVSFQWKLLITASCLLSILVLLEIGEYLFDVFWGLKMQGVYLRDITGLEKYKLVLDPNDDTMIDLMMGLAGISIFTIGKTAYYILAKRYSFFRNSKLL